MIIADKITEERKKNGWSQEELAARLSVSRQTVSKWEGAQSVPDLQKVIMLAEVFGVSTDYLLKDEINTVAPDQKAVLEEGTALRKVSMEEANDFMNMRKKHAPMIAKGVALCILSPALLILLAGFSDDHVLGITENLAAGIGLIVLLSMVAAAVYLFISSGMKEENFEYLQKEAFETAYGVSGLVKEKKASYEETFTRRIAAGVVLCIIAVVPLVSAGCLDAADSVCCAMTSLLLVLVAVGVYLMVEAGLIRSSYETLLQEGEYAAEEKKIKKKTESFSSVYWCLTTAIYLAWSLWTMKWETTWVIWPVAGVLFAAVYTVAKTIVEKKD